MFVGWREIRFAKGRFLLIGTTVALIMVLVGFLSGLTGGLAVQNVAGVLGWPADRIVFGRPSGAAVTFADSEVTRQQAAQWQQATGIRSVDPVGVSQTRARSTQASAAVTVFGVEPGWVPTSPTRDGALGLSSEAAQQLQVGVGDPVTIDGRGFVVETIGGEWWYSHTPVVQMAIADWRAMAPADGSFASVLVVTGDADWSALDATAGTRSTSVLDALTAIPAFRSETGSLLLMVAMLFAISALVVGAFFTVWTMQRKGDIAVLKALGASTRTLVRDALGQALVVLLGGIGVGLAAVVGFGLMVGSVLPFLLSPLTTLVPALVMVALGLLGAGLALRSVTTADQLTALGANR